MAQRHEIPVRGAASSFLDVVSTNVCSTTCHELHYSLTQKWTIHDFSVFAQRRYPSKKQLVSKAFYHQCDPDAKWEMRLTVDYNQSDDDYEYLSSHYRGDRPSPKPVQYFVRFALNGKNLSRTVDNSAFALCFDTADELNSDRDVLWLDYTSTPKLFKTGDGGETGSDPGDASFDFIPLMFTDDTVTIEGRLTVRGLHPVVSSEQSIGGATYNGANTCFSGTSGKIQRTGLTESLGSLLASGKRSDLKIAVGFEEFPVHKIVLKSQSPVFRTMFSGEYLENQRNRLEISDVSSAAFGLFWGFLYGQLPGPQQFSSCASELLFLGEKYSVPSLTHAVESVLIESLSLDTACQYLALADLYSAGELRAHCVRFIVDHRQEMQTREEWELFVKNHSAMATEVMAVCFQDSY